MNKNEKMFGSIFLFPLLMVLKHWKHIINEKIKLKIKE
tara:strand:- start:555 stop:668 length:114 start_codon:yes stop_codon:yes gene_type:complete